MLDVGDLRPARRACIEASQRDHSAGAFKLSVRTLRNAQFSRLHSPRPTRSRAHASPPRCRVRRKARYRLRRLAPSPNWFRTRWTTSRI
jgi:hypothetical protein